MIAIEELLERAFLHQLLLVLNDPDASATLIALGYTYKDVDQRTRHNVTELVEQFYDKLGGKAFFDEMFTNTTRTKSWGPNVVTVVCASLGAALLHEVCYRFYTYHNDWEPWIPTERVIRYELQYGSAFWFLDSRYQPFCERLFRAVPFRLSISGPQADIGYEIKNGVVFPKWLTRGWRHE